MKTIENWTPLHIAVRQGCADSIDKLIQCGCNIDETGGRSQVREKILIISLPKSRAFLKKKVIHKFRSVASI